MPAASAGESTFTGPEYFCRVGGFSGATGAGVILVSVSNVPPVAPPNCVETVGFIGGNSGGEGGAIYFDIDATMAVSLSEITLGVLAPFSVPVGIEVYTTPGTHVGAENDSSLWSLVGYGRWHDCHEQPLPQHGLHSCGRRR